MSAGTRERVFQITDKLDRAVTHLELAQMLGTVDTVGMDKLLTSLDADATALAALVAPVSQPSRTQSERLVDLINAVVMIAKEVGARIYKTDALASKVCMTVPSEVQPYWLGLRPQQVSGLLLNEKSVAAELAKRGVLVWFNEPDQRWRIVDTNWLTAHAGIRKHITSERIPGRVCRFCRMFELPSIQLYTVDRENRGPLSTVNGVVQLEPGRVYLHDQCVPSWNQWLAIANRYPTQEAAEQADREAGRVSNEPPKLEIHELDPAPSERFEHVSTGEKPASNYGNYTSVTE